MSKKSFPAEHYALPFFKEEGFIRKLCPRCGDYFWTQNAQMETCGEASSDECGCYTFIGEPAAKKPFSLHEMREAFLGFFEKNGHTHIKPYPVVARWRSDIYLTHASIIDFQPYVTEGIAPPPANPLVISQPSIRLTDIPNTGPTFGRHLTIFEMGGAHAFNYPDKEVYWKDQTVRYHHLFATEALGIPSEEVVYKEGVWVGGGNAGPDVECIVRGLEVGTLVFMQYKVVGDEFVQLPIRTVDTGYGIDRFTWISQGTPSAFQAIYGDMLNKVYAMAGISNVDNDFLARVGTYSGLVNVDKTANRMVLRKRVSQLTGIDLATLEKELIPIENAWALTDHTKTLCFMLSEGVVPSNIQEGYLARLLFRRAYRLALGLNMDIDRLYDIVDLQVAQWGKDFPQIKAMRNEILEMLKMEEEKFKDTLKRGEGMVKRIASELKAKGVSQLSNDTLSELYDSHGLPPEIVKQAAEAEGVAVEVPENFYSLVADRHMQADKPTEEEPAAEHAMEVAVEGLPPTELMYYPEPYTREWDAKVLKVINAQYVVLDGTCFYPEGGGQPADHGYFAYEGGVQAEVTDVQKVGRVVVHKVQTETALPKEGSMVRGILDWKHRYTLMKAHTGTHLVNGAARRVLGEHVWQSGTQKGIESTRLDISHYRRLTPEEIHKIERLANEAVLANMSVETTWLPRSEAEARYGFRLYQGGAVPGKEIRVVKTGNWDVEACAGTHLKSTGEIGYLKILYSERVQDGVERLGYAVGMQAVKAVQKQETLLQKVAETLNAPLEKLDKTAERMVRELKEANSEKKKLLKELAAKESGALAESAAETEQVAGVTLVKRDFGADADVNRMVQTANEILKRNQATVTLFYGEDAKSAKLMVMAGTEAVAKGVHAGNVVKVAAPVFGGGGGGKPYFAQGGGTQPDKLPDAVKAAEEAIKKQLNV
ncbi:MAG: alanine--tRNA ligase [Candidatus Bathyarchaeota archaeon]|nr:alanine--tRNA ligase [Candidatus Bathyarchaeota archaeon]